MTATVDIEFVNVWFLSARERNELMDGLIAQFVERPMALFSNFSSPDFNQILPVL